MINSPHFLRSILDSVAEQIVVIDGQGSIAFVNQSWVNFAVANGCRTGPDEWLKVNYLAVCDKSGSRSEVLALSAAAGIRKVIERKMPRFEMEYPCHSRSEKRWFTMSVTPLTLEGVPYFAISHQNITKRKLAEQLVLELSQIDGLTGIPNRRCFDKFLADEWKRCKRQNLPITVAILDIDHFKLLNDHYGHQKGDACLVRIGEVLNGIKKRPSDLFARYGGEEFAFVFGNLATEQAVVPVNKIVEAVRALEIPHAVSPTDPHVTVSVGIATMLPDDSNTEKGLVAAADARLYSAKHNGRNRIVSS